jgi:hypothetical protein
MENTVEFTNKISVATVCGNVKEIVKPMTGGESKAIMRVVGIANGTQAGEGDNGPWIALKGEFKATNLLNNKSFISGKCFLPSAVSDLVSGQLGGEVQKVQFAFDIVIVEDIKSQVGYHYNAVPLMKPQENNALSLLEHQIKK